MMNRIIIKFLIVLLAITGLSNSFQVNSQEAINTIDLRSIETLSTITTIPENYFGLNGYGALDIESGMDDRFIENLKILNPQNYRFHDYIQSDSGINFRAFADEENQTWDRTKINRFAEMIKKWRANSIDPDITVTIASFPIWMKRVEVNGIEREILDPSEYDNYAQFVAELVKILNIEENLGIEKIEITNELDKKYGLELEDEGLAHRISDLSDIYIKSAQAVKNIDPNIRIGGLSFAQPFREGYIDTFLNKVSPYPHLIDFLSVHTYASGDKSESSKEILDKANGNLEALNAIIKTSLSKNNLDIPVYLNEYNISWTRENDDPRMRNFIGSLYESMVFIAGLKNDFNLISSWADKDSVYGKMDNEFNLVPSSRVYQMLNKNLYSGQVLDLKLDDIYLKNLLVKDNNTYKLLIVNRSEANKTVNFSLPENIINTKYLSANESNNNFLESDFNSSILSKSSIHYFEFEKNEVEGEIIEEKIENTELSKEVETIIIQGDEIINTSPESNPVENKDLIISVEENLDRDQELSTNENETVEIIQSEILEKNETILVRSGYKSYLYSSVAILIIISIIVIYMKKKSSFEVRL